jgi:hypothetical protein
MYVREHGLTMGRLGLIFLGIGWLLSFAASVEPATDLE